MKKVLAILLVLMLAVSLFGCGGDEPVKDNSSDTNASDSAESDNVTVSTPSNDATSKDESTNKNDSSVPSTSSNQSTTNNSSTPDNSSSSAPQKPKEDITFGKVGILGDSYSTYAGYIPTGYKTWYAANGDGNNLQNNNINSVEQTWWNLLLKETKSQLGLNESYSDTTIGGIGYGGADVTSTSFLTRAEKAFNGNEKFDTIFIFGGLNDFWANNNNLSSLQYGDWTDTDKKYTLPAFCYMLHFLKEKNPNTRIVVIIDSYLPVSYANGMIRASEYYGADCIALKNISKENGHPNVEGMQQIKNQIIDFYEK